jgi:membrane protein
MFSWRDREMSTSATQTATAGRLAPSWINLLRDTFVAWRDDECMRLAAALAYYAVFAVSPLIVLAILFVGVFYGTEAAQGHVAAELEAIMAPKAAEAVQDMIASSEQQVSSIWAILPLLATLFAVSAMFGELQSALNFIWKVRPKPSAGWWRAVLSRLLALGLVIFVGSLFLILLLLNSLTQAAWSWLEPHLPFSSSVAGSINYLVTLVVVTLLFAIIFRYLPDATIAWRDVWLGALVTAALFALGNALLGVYFGYSAVGSAYGAAGSLVIFLLWAYYSAAIVYFGAEFTQVYARMYGSQIRPEAHAERLAEPPPSARG